MAQRKPERVRSRYEAFIVEIDRRILKGDSLDHILRRICDEVVARLGYPLVQISLKSTDGSVVVRMAGGREAAFVQGLRVRWDDGPDGLGPTGRAIRTGIVQQSDVGADPGFAPWRERALAHGLRSVLALPLIAQENIVGALTLFSSDGDGFGETDEDFRDFADQMALSIAAASDQQKIRLQTAALEAAANAIVVTDRNGVIQWVNPAFTTLTGFAASDAIGQTPRILRSGNHSAAFYRQMWETLTSGQVWRGEMYNRRSSGEVYIEEQTITPVRDEQGAITHFVAIKQDISERKRQEEQIRHLAMHDTLTNLPNRRAFDSTFERILRIAQSDHLAAVLILDIDDFKLVNDSAGHAVGDELLSDIASTLLKLLRPDDFIARLGGDEFVVLLREVDDDQAMTIAERLRRSVEEMWFVHNGVPLHASISIGMAIIDGTADQKTLIARADAALYSAKERGKNRICAYPFCDDIGVQIAEASEWLSRLKMALREHRFSLYFQPVVRLGSGEPEHYEALVRLHEDGAVITPDRFLPIAERYGLMPQIDRWVFEEVLRKLEEHPLLRIFANLSGASLNDEILLQYIEERIRRSTIPPGRLGFEITESAAVNDFSSTRNWIHRLKELGCLFALDDFGIGFSSFGYLRALAVDYVKIDRTFIRDLDTNLTNRALVQAVKTVAHTLGKEVIAEGVECEAHAAVLRELGVEHGQGYHWGKPMMLV